VAGPAWLAYAVAAAMLVIAAFCAGRLVTARLRRRATEADADMVHAAMGVAMAGMLVPRLSLLPGSVWAAVFATAAAWFGWQAALARRGGVAGRWRCPSPGPHVAECAAMVYMALAIPVPGSGSGPGMAMPALSGPAGGSFLVLAMILALCMLGYVLWTADRLTSRTRAMATANAAPSLVLAPRMAAISKITMGVAMGYMLVLML
jgi:Domain of unknown function (DUF5134)